VGDWAIVEASDGDRSGQEAAWNMALDAANLDAVLANRSLSLVRLYAWAAPAVTLGRFQDPATSLRSGFCREYGLPVARRPTGGRGVLHGDDIIVSIAASLDSLELRADTAISGIYDDLAAIFVRAFSRVGVAAVQGRRTDAHFRGRANCMEAVTRADIAEEATGAKLMGAALLRRAGAVLLQCSVPVNAAEANSEALAPRVFAGATVSAEPARRGCVDAPAFMGAVTDELASRFGAHPVTARLTRSERVSVGLRAREHEVSLTSLFGEEPHN
jgi:lipoate-protein ligase A